MQVFFSVSAKRFRSLRVDRFLPSTLHLRVDLLATLSNDAELCLISSIRPRELRNEFESKVSTLLALHSFARHLYELLSLIASLVCLDSSGNELCVIARRGSAGPKFRIVRAALKILEKYLVDSLPLFISKVSREALSLIVSSVSRRPPRENSASTVKNPEFPTSFALFCPFLRQILGFRPRAAQRQARYIVNSELW